MKLKEIRVDGYKNLINCRVPLGDFNVLVGPNNSGKTNFLETFMFFALACFGNEKTRDSVFKGYPIRGAGSSICHLEKSKNNKITFGITLELRIKKKTWVVQYDASIQCHEHPLIMTGFKNELLKAKELSKTGSAKTYIKRDEKVLNVGNKKHSIAPDNSSFDAIKTLYPEYKELSSEFEIIINSVINAICAQVFAISPEGLRKAIDEEEEFEGLRISSFDLLEAMEQIKGDDERLFELFKETVCNILDLEEMIFIAKEITIPSKKGDIEEAIDYVKYCYIKSKGSDIAPIEEFSDGTLVVVSILAALLSKKRLGPMLFLEELENCLHPAAVERLLSFLQENADRWPVLVTTHSPYIVNGVKPADVIVAVVDETGATHFEKITDRKALNNYLGLAE